MKIAIDIGYSQTKITAPDGKLFKFPTAISFAIDSGINYGEDEIYEFEGKKYRVGEIASEESFTTTEYKFLNKFAPLVIFHVLNKLKLIDKAQKEVIQLRTGLALTDWAKKDEFIERIKNININGITIKTEPILIPQGAGVYYDYVVSKCNNQAPSSASIIDIGYNTINFLVFQNGAPVKSQCKAFPGHGVVSIIRPLTNWLEAKYSTKFPETQVNKFLMDEKFIYYGENQEDAIKMIKQLKLNFVEKLFNSILVSEKKILGMSEKVIISGGGTYMLENVAFPKNVDFTEKPYEFSNVRGYFL